MDFDPVGGGYLFENIFSRIFSINESSAFLSLVIFLKRLSVVLIFAFLVLSIWMAMELWKFRPKFHITSRPFVVPPEKIAKARWGEVMRRFEVGMESDWALAVIEADNLVDDILKRIGFSGESMAERMSQLNPSEFPAVSALKEAHRLRNNIAHTPGFKISRADAEKTLRKYERVLKEFEVL